MTKPRKPRKQVAPMPATASDESDSPKTVAEIFDRQRTLDALPTDVRAVLAAEAAPGAPAENLPLAAGATLSERMRRGARLQHFAEAEFPNVREEEAKAPRRWAEYRKSQARWQTELENDIALSRKIFAEGNLGALMDTLIHSSHRDGCLYGALSLHGDHWVEIPRWAVDALTVVLAETLPTIRERGRGKYARWLTTWRQDQLDLDRWKTVRMLREHGVRFTDGKVYEEAVRYLGSEVPVEADTIRKSYLRVQKRMKSQPSRYSPLTYVRAVNQGD